MMASTNVKVYCSGQLPKTRKSWISAQSALNGIILVLKIFHYQLERQTLLVVNAINDFFLSSVFC